MEYGESSAGTCGYTRFLEMNQMWCHGFSAKSRFSAHTLAEQLLDYL
jgi:hypothetical protein